MQFIWQTIVDDFSFSSEKTGLRKLIFGSRKTAKKLSMILCFFSLTFDPFTRDNFWNILIGTGFYSIMHPGTHQLQVQRYSGMASVDKAKQ